MIPFLDEAVHRPPLPESAISFMYNKKPRLATGLKCVSGFCREIDGHNQRPLLFSSGFCVAFIGL